MGNPIRMFGAHSVWFITARNFQARRLMLPTSPLVREVCGGVLARAARRYRVKVHAYAFLSNHLHLIIGAQGPTIAAFMQYLLSNLARKLTPLCQAPWWGRFWERRYAAAPILDAESLEGRLRYVLAHGVKEGLVARIADWEGLHCGGQFLDQAPRSFRWFDWTRRWCSPQRPARYSDAVAEVESLELAPLPHWDERSMEERRCWAREVILSVEREHRRPHVLGMRAIKREGMEPPKRRKRTPQPLCHAVTVQAIHDHRRAYFAFVDAFRGASASFRAGDSGVDFPAGAFRPPTHSVPAPN